MRADKDVSWRELAMNRLIDAAIDTGLDILLGPPASLRAAHRKSARFLRHSGRSEVRRGEALLANARGRLRRATDHHVEGLAQLLKGRQAARLARPSRKARQAPTA